MYGLLRGMGPLITEENPVDNLSGMWATVITGLVVVFVILCLLIAFLYLLGFVTKGIDKAAGAKEAKKNRAVSAPPAPAVTAPVPAPAAKVRAGGEENGDGEIIAVIAAAIAAYGAADGKQYVIKKIKKTDNKARSDWGSAGVFENTRPF